MSVSHTMQRKILALISAADEFSCVTGSIEYNFTMHAFNLYNYYIHIIKLYTINVINHLEKLY